MTTPARPQQAQKSPREAGGFGGKIGASTAGGEIPAAGDFATVVSEEPTMTLEYDGTRSCACHPPFLDARLACCCGGVA